MKILATFDGSRFSEAILPQLLLIARLPGAEFTLFGVASEHGGVLRDRGTQTGAIGEAFGAVAPVTVKGIEPKWAENHGQAIERHQAEFVDYLHGIRAQLPADAQVEIEVATTDHPSEAIVQAARAREVDVIVMATHSRASIIHVFFGSTTEQVVRSGVAPVLLVHPPKD
jgi:nucleotide-binding universal stress UspA family protein